MSRAPTYRDVKPVRDLVTDDEAWEAKANLDRTVHDFADRLARKEIADLAVKRIYADLYDRSVAPSHERRKLDVEKSIHYHLAVKQAVECKRAFTELQQQQEMWRLTVDLWRTVSANKRERDKLEHPGAYSR